MLCLSILQARSNESADLSSDPFLPAPTRAAILRAYAVSCLIASLMRSIFPFTLAICTTNLANATPIWFRFVLTRNLGLVERGERLLLGELLRSFDISMAIEGICG